MPSIPTGIALSRGSSPTQGNRYQVEVAFASQYGMTPYGDHVVEVLEKAAGSVLCRSPVTPLKRAGNVAKLTVEAAIWDALVIRITDPIGRSATSSPIAVI